MPSLSRSYRLHADNAEIFSSGRYRYYFDLPITARTCKNWQGEHEPKGPIHQDLREFCELLTGESAWNDFSRYARWGYLDINLLLADQDRLMVQPYIASHYRFAFVRKRDAMMFKLAWMGL